MSFQYLPPVRQVAAVLDEMRVQPGQIARCSCGLWPT
jgi:hypothetical protein